MNSVIATGHLANPQLHVISMSNPYGSRFDSSRPPPLACGIIASDRKQEISGFGAFLLISFSASRTS